MKTSLYRAILASFFLCSMVISSQATDMEHHHPGDEAAMSSNEMHGIMMQRMEMMQDEEMKGGKPCVADGMPCSKPCMAEAIPPARHHRKGGGMSDKMGMNHGMAGMMGMNPRMHQRMEHELFLDRADALDLTTVQVGKLKAILSECRKENIRKAADVQIARLELKDLMNEVDWTLKTAESLIRQIQTLEGDMLVRHLQAVVEARGVLTAEQLKKAAVGEGNEDLEELFK